MNLSVERLQFRLQDSLSKSQNLFFLDCISNLIHQISYNLYLFLNLVNMLEKICDHFYGSHFKSFQQHAFIGNTKVYLLKSNQL